MWYLLFDTSSERGVVFLFHDKELVFNKELPLGLQNSQFLVPTIEEGLKECKIEVKDLFCIAVGVGPGSYTGVRVSAAVAKALSFAHKIPLVGISALKTFIPKEERCFAAMIDARMGGVYLAIGEKREAKVHFTLDSKVMPLKEVIPLLETVDFLITPWALTLREKISREFEEKAPDPYQMLDLALKKLQEHKETLDGSLDLLYLQEWLPQ